MDGEGNGYRGKTGSLGTQTEGCRGVDSGRKGVQVTQKHHQEEVSFRVPVILHPELLLCVRKYGVTDRYLQKWGDSAMRGRVYCSRLFT